MIEIKIDKIKNVFIINNKEYPPTRNNYEIWKKLKYENNEKKILELINKFSDVVLDI